MSGHVGSGTLAKGGKVDGIVNMAAEQPATGIIHIQCNQSAGTHDFQDASLGLVIGLIVAVIVKMVLCNIRDDSSQSNVDKITSIEESLKGLEKIFNDLHDEKTVLAAASVILKDGGIKAKIIKQYVPIINKLINKYLSAMDFFVQFDLNEQFEETIKSRFRDAFTYASFSEGEKMRINLAILFTWRALAKLRNSINTNLLIMDEVFDSSLDSNGTEEFLKILQSLTTDTNTFIISHKQDQLYDKFEKVIKFEKHKNFSRMI